MLTMLKESRRIAAKGLCAICLLGPGLTSPAWAAQAKAEASAKSTAQPAAQPSPQPTAAPQPPAQTNQTVVAAQPAPVAEEEDDDGLADEVVGIKPQFGILRFDGVTGEGITRFAVGMLIEGNFLADVGDDDDEAASQVSSTVTSGGTDASTVVATAEKREKRENRPYFGPSVGVLYSHVGDPGSNFFGLDAPDGEDGGADLVQIPLDLKLGWTFVEKIRPAVHGGANVLYQHEGGDDTRAFDGTDWTVDPNFGADLELGLGGVAFMLRADWTFRDGPELFTGTFGISFPVD